MPKPVRLLYVCNVVVILLFVVDSLAGSPWAFPSRFVDLDRERNLPTWYSSMQIFVTAVLVGLTAQGIAQRGNRLTAMPFYLLSGVFLLFSLDEVAGIHEWLGEMTDALLPGGSREGTLLAVTGIWMFVIGIPAALAVACLIWKVRSRFAEAGVLRLLVIGSLLFFGGSLGVEILSNINYRPTVVFFQVILEEAGEMFGMTTILWACLELLRRQRPTISLS